MVPARIMLGVVFVILLWLVLGLGTFLIAMSGKGKGASGAAKKSDRTGATTFFFAVTLVAFGIALPLALLTGNHANASSQFAGVKLNAAEKEGRILFGQHCGVCHTLAAANAVGKVGPNLDDLQPPQSLVLSTIQNGLSVGHGTMPQGIVVGKQAIDVADFVSKVAGK